VHPLKTFAKLRMWPFLWNLFEWECILTLGIAAIFIHSGSPLRIEREDWQVYGPTLLLGPVAVVVCANAWRQFGALQSILFGAASSAAIVIVGGYGWASTTPGFERQAGVFVASLFLSVPAGFAGGTVAWLNRRKS
jgi:hypothetical protein